MSRRTRRTIVAWSLVAGYMVLIFILSSIPMGGGLSPHTFNDKVLHAIEYGVFCALLFVAFRTMPQKWVHRLAPLLALVVAAAYGATDEVHQGFVGRDMDLADWIADVAGAGIVALVLQAWCLMRDLPPEKP